MENINILEIIKQCPEGTKFYCTVLGECYTEVIDLDLYPITVHTSDDSIKLTKFGREYADKGECILFPSKDQRDWNKFVIPKPDLPVDTPVAVSDDRIFWGVQLYKERGLTLSHKGSSIDTKWKYIVPLDKLRTENGYFFDPEDNYGTTSGRWK